MKKIIGIVIASLVFCNVGFAEIITIEESTVDFKGDAHTSNYANTGVSTICVDGYKFVATNPGVVPILYHKALAASSPYWSP